MDEEDGRPGPRARQFGRIDVLTDASDDVPVLPSFTFQVFSRDACCISWFRLIHNSNAFASISVIKENCNENVPGK